VLDCLGAVVDVRMWQVASLALPLEGALLLVRCGAL
jgi:hypothetical protein